MTKLCGKCRQYKPKTDFRNDGKAWNCRVCHNAETRASRLANPERTRQIEAARYRKYKKAKAEYQRKRDAMYPERYRAYGRVRYAIKMGWLVRPPECQKCKKQTRVIAHHADYAKPLDVEWICRACHTIQHNQDK